MSKIKNIIARETLDSRGRPTVEVTVENDVGDFLAAVPSGASTGKNEALELRDEDGRGVSLAIENVNKILAPKLKGRNPENQKEIDDLMIQLDGTENKSRLGANAILAVSMAVCRAGAGARKALLYQHIAELVRVTECPTFQKFGRSDIHRLKIPLAMFNILEGGAHADNDLAIQEFMVVPQKESFSENLIICNKIFQNLNEILTKNYLPAGGQVVKIKLGDEGGFAPAISKTEQALIVLKTAIANLDAKIALDCAASQFFSSGKYRLEGQELTRAELLKFYQNLLNNFSIISIEDPFAEEDWNGFEEIMRNLSHTPAYGREIIIVGDDLTTTNIKKIKEAHNKNACSGVILKPNQIGTVSETIEAAILAKSFGWKTIISHRSGETMDDFIADLAVGLSTDYIKSGSPVKEERMVKYSRLLEIEREL